MDYIRLTNLTNKYPQIGNYIPRQTGDATLYGLYEETNKIDFKLKEFEKQVYPIKDISTRYIFKIIIDTNDLNLPPNNTNTLPYQLINDSGLNTRVVFSEIPNLDESEMDIKKNIVKTYYCSEQYYKDLVSSKNSGNPYFIDFSFKPEFMIEININSFLKLFASQKEKEAEAGIIVKLNNFIFEDVSYNIENFIKYIDWVLKKPSLTDIDTDGVIPAIILSNIVKGKFDKLTGKWDFTTTTPLFDTTGTSGTSGTSGNQDPSTQPVGGTSGDNLPPPGSGNQGNGNSGGGTGNSNSGGSNSGSGNSGNTGQPTSNNFQPFGVPGLYIDEERRYFNIQMNDYDDYIWTGTMWERN